MTSGIHGLNFPFPRVRPGITVTELDHATDDSLLADFDRYRGGIFCFRCGRTGGMDYPWELSAAVRRWGGGSTRYSFVRLRLEYKKRFGLSGMFNFYTDGRLLECGSYGGTAHDVSVVALLLPPGPPSADDSMRRRLDNNLRGVFA